MTRCPRRAAREEVEAHRARREEAAQVAAMRRYTAILARDNRKYSDEKSPAGKTDYHTMGACYEVLNVIG